VNHFNYTNTIEGRGGGEMKKILEISAADFFLSSSIRVIHLLGWSRKNGSL